MLHPKRYHGGPRKLGRAAGTRARARGQLIPPPGKTLPCERAGQQEARAPRLRYRRPESELKLHLFVSVWHPAWESDSLSSGSSSRSSRDRSS